MTLHWHEGACHCGHVSFRVKLTANILITECNCGICYKHGHREILVHETRFGLLRGSEFLKEYRFGNKIADHTFCVVCGVLPFYRPRSHPKDHFSVNARCLDLSFADSIEIVAFDGRNWDASIAAGQHKMTE